jgi:hypothetical protein
MAFLEQRDLARRGREAREWLTYDERGRTIGLVVLSLTISIAMSLLATALVGVFSRRRAAAPIEARPPDVGEPMADVVAAPEQVVGVPVIGLEVSMTKAPSAQAVGA